MNCWFHPIWKESSLKWKDGEKLLYFSAPCRGAHKERKTNRETRGCSIAWARAPIHSWHAAAPIAARRGTKNAALLLINADPDLFKKQWFFGRSLQFLAQRLFDLIRTSHKQSWTALNVHMVHIRKIIILSKSARCGNSAMGIEFIDWFIAWCTPNSIR